MSIETPYAIRKEQIGLTRHSSSYWRVTFDIAPLNIFGPANVPGLRHAFREPRKSHFVAVGGGRCPSARGWTHGPASALIGRGRALEVLLAADDIPGDLAERYGYVNRALPDAELHSFVDALATRIASFGKQAIANTKRLVDVASLPSDAEIAPEWKAFMASLTRPAAQKRIQALMERGFHRPGDAETRLGYYVGQLGR